MGEGYAAQDAVGGHYVTEIIVPFMASGNSSVRRPVETRYLQTVSDVRANAMKVRQQESILLPGSDNWLYFKLYGGIKRKGELFSFIYEQLESLVHEKQIEKYFFVRYSDPKPHLRVRIQVSNKELFPQVFKCIMVWLENLRQRGIISSVAYDTYQRETERYGGVKLIKDAEEYFFQESRIVLRILHRQHTERLEINWDFLGISFLVMVMQAFGMSLTDIDKCLSEQIPPNKFRKEYQKGRKQYMVATNRENNWAKIRESVEYPQIYDELISLEGKLAEYARAVFQADQIRALTNYRIDIASTVIHMFCNRLIGDTVWESKIYFLARHGIHDLIGYMRHNSPSLTK